MADSVVRRAGSPYGSPPSDLPLPERERGHPGVDLVGRADLGLPAADAADRAGRPPLGRRSATGTRAPLDPVVAADAVTQTFEVMAPARRSWQAAPAGRGERYRFRRTDGPESWTVVFTPEQVLLEPGSAAAVDVEIEGPASDLALFLWQRLPAAGLRATGGAALLPYYFTLVPPV
ncbi:hypothetical protein [Streptomyces sp. NPDC054849]